MRYLLASLLVGLSLFWASGTWAAPTASDYVDFTTWYQQQHDQEVPFRAAAVVMADSFEPLYYHREALPLPTASLIKLLTAGALVQYPVNWSQALGFSWWDNEGDLRKHVGPRDPLSLLRLPDGDTVSVHDALVAMLIRSANNAANALPGVPEHNRLAFFDQMRFVASAWGMTQTTIKEPTGLSLDNVSTAHDLALAGCHAFAHPDIAPIAALPSYTVHTSQGQDLQIQHTVHAVREHPDRFFGAKTGFLYETGFHVVAGIITPDGQRICAAILSTPTRAGGEDMLFALADWVDVMYPTTTPSMINPE